MMALYECLVNRHSEYECEQLAENNAHESNLFNQLRFRQGDKLVYACALECIWDDIDKEWLLLISAIEDNVPIPPEITQVAKGLGKEYRLKMDVVEVEDLCSLSLDLAE